MLYTTIDPNRHWFFNTSLIKLLNKDLKHGSLFNLFKLIYFNKHHIILTDSYILEKLFILLFANRKLSIVLHGELGYMNHYNYKYKIFYFFLNLIIKFSRCKIILLSRYVLTNFKCKEYLILEHPGYFLINQKLKYTNQLLAVGSISFQKLDLNGLIDLNFLISNNNTFISHFGNSSLNINLSNVFFNGYVNHDKLNQIISTSKYLLLINSSKYENIVSGVVIQAIYNKCIIVTLNTFPEIIQFYENHFDVKIHIDIVSFLNLKDKNRYYDLNINQLDKVKNELTKLSINDASNIIKL